MDKFFKISERGSNVKTEIIAGLITFFAMSYIVVTNPNQIVGFNFAGDFDKIWLATYVASILVPAFLALIMMPLTYSISNGIAVACIAHTILALATKQYTKKDIPVTVIAVLFLARFFLVTY